jgi:carbon-monoxide dehydrogenase small subunit
MSERQINVRVNGREVARSVAGARLLREFLRDDLGLTGTKIGCEDGMCGACAVLVDGAAVKSCLVLAAQVDGSAVTTIEGIATDCALSGEQEAMIDNFGFQCGFCTPGVVVTMTALLDGDEVYDDEESVREALVGNICRCTGYTMIVDAFFDAQRRRRS